jgi:hypothetical protein
VKVIFYNKTAYKSSKKKREKEKFWGRQENPVISDSTGGGSNDTKYLAEHFAETKIAKAEFGVLFSHPW